MAILASVGTIVSIVYIKKTGSNLVIIPIALSLLTQLFYWCDGYMNPKIHENLYRLVSVERKWESLFEESDSYELHFSPVETGGFFVNTALYGLFYAFFYEALVFPYPNSWFGYIIPIFIMGMSIIDILVVCGVEISAFFSFIASIVIGIISISIGLVGPTFDKNENLKTKAIYKQCVEVASWDYSKSYEFEFTRKDRAEVGSREPSEVVNFIYDANLEAGGYYTFEGNDKVFNKVIIKDSHFDNQITQFSRIEGERLEYILDGYTSIVGGPLKYTKVDYPFEKYSEFTEEKFFDATTSISKYKSNKVLSVSYGHTTNQTSVSMLKGNIMN